MFKYGSFFGLSAVHLMFLRAKDIDRIFKFTNMKPSTTTLIRNLYLETKLLREIFSPTSTEAGIPRVVMKKDLQDPAVQNLIAGLNNFIASKKSVELPDAEVDLDDLSDLSVLEDISETESTAQTTSYFGSEESASLNEEVSNSFEGLADVEIPDMDLDFVDVDVNIDTTTSYSYNDLILWGQKITPTEKTVETMAAVTRYIRTHKADFSEEEYTSITRQIAELPSIPIAVQLPATLKQAVAPASEQTMKFLKVLYTKMSRKVGGVTFVDYILMRLETLLFSSQGNSTLLFFAPTADFSRDKAISGVNYFITNLQSQYLHSSNAKVITSNISILLSNCEDVLGLSQHAEEKQILQSITEKLTAWETNIAVYPIDSQRDCIRELLSFADLQSLSDAELDSVTEVVSRLVAMGLMHKLLANPDNLKMVLSLYCVLYTVTTREMFAALELYKDVPEPTAATSLEQINKYCVEAFIRFAQETGICGLYCKFEENFFGTLRNIEVPLAERTHEVFIPGSNNFMMAKLLRLHLLSLRKRLTRQGVK